MKKILLFVVLFLSMFAFTSCKDNTDYSNLTFEDVFEIQHLPNEKDIQFAPGLTMAQLTSKTLEGAHEFYEYMSFNLKAKYKVTIKSVTFTMATNETEFQDYHFSLKKDGEAKYYVQEFMEETTPTITKTFSLNPEYTLSSGKVICVMPGVSKGQLYSKVGKNTIYNFSFNFEVLGK